MKNVKALISFEINVECTHCEETIDLISEVETDNEWTKLLASWLKNELCADLPNKEVECPKCEKNFTVNELEY